MTMKRNVSGVSSADTDTQTLRVASGRNRDHQQLPLLFVPARTWNPEAPGHLSCTTVKAGIGLVSRSKVSVTAVFVVSGETRCWVEMLIKFDVKQ